MGIGKRRGGRVTTPYSQAAMARQHNLRKALLWVNQDSVCERPDVQWRIDVATQAPAAKSMPSVRCCQGVELMGGVSLQGLGDHDLFCEHFQVAHPHVERWRLHQQ